MVASHHERRYKQMLKQTLDELTRGRVSSWLRMSGAESILVPSVSWEREYLRSRFLGSGRIPFGTGFRREVCRCHKHTSASTESSVRGWVEYFVVGGGGDTRLLSGFGRDIVCPEFLKGYYLRICGMRSRCGRKREVGMHLLDLRERSDLVSSPIRVQFVMKHGSCWTSPSCPVLESTRDGGL